MSAPPEIARREPCDIRGLNDFDRLIWKHRGLLVEFREQTPMDDGAEPGSCDTLNPAWQATFRKCFDQLSPDDQQLL